MSKTKRSKPDVSTLAVARVKAFIKERGDLSRAAERIGVGLPTVYRWFSGRARPTAVYARLILSKLAP